jgi:hypothetical protein
MAERERLTLEKQPTETKHPNTSRAPRPVSAKQIEANRRNALHSTGPTTQEGKEASRLNALTHGLRAKELVIPGQEDPIDLEAILRELSEDWAPEGHTERDLVEQIGFAEWRLRRVRRAELGEIRKQTTKPTASDVEAEIESTARLFPGRLPQILRRSTTGIAYLREAVEYAIIELGSTGIVSEKTCLRLEGLFGKGPNSPASFLKLWFFGEMPEWLKDRSTSNGVSPPTAFEGEADKKAAAREDLETTLYDLDREGRKLQRRERINLEIARQQLSIPNGPQLERIQRYETAIKREMRRDIDQLERLQRRRRGEPVPPTVNLNVSKDD